MLSTNRLHIDGRRHTLLPATTLEANRAEVLLVQADGQERRTALALALTGRMKPSTGTVVLGHNDSMASLRRSSAIIDAPDVNAPEYHLTVKSLASEDLALVPTKFRERTRPTEWLVTHGFRDILDNWIDELAPARLLHLQLELALADRDVDLLVVDSPDRHTADVDAWLPLLEQAAAGELGLGPHIAAGSQPRQLLVVGVVGRLPDRWEGPAIVAGNANSADSVEDSGGVVSSVAASGRREAASGRSSETSEGGTTPPTEPAAPTDEAPPGDLPGPAPSDPAPTSTDPSSPDVSSTNPSSTNPSSTATLADEAAEESK
ncbi:ABC transporter ATP-binding protein [Arthrobacter sp. H35-D1]|uniref:ABC transporter ATP-binding protein n=1 Tax=Arthrobacter sp. H35-D1 TaxID=3046202 RepID=UPI0024BAC20A|nr:ABC transporter ATP-binding protein [Arthrobacter sp. H35-D1]MDJ0311662.1 ABC transporter ATP-binding protein [Arthrobacter sp. H35-D1]